MAKPQEDYDFTVEFAKLFIPPQKPPQPSSLLLPPDMARELISYPAVGLATQCADHVVPFVAALEVDRSQSDKPWQVSVWGSIDDGPWSETVLGAPDQSSEPWIHNMQGGAASTIMLYFEGKFTVGKTMSFTLRYRCGDTEWKWIKDEKGRDDGVVVINKGSTRDGIDIKLESTIEHLNTSLAAHSELSETPNTRVWSIRAPVGPSQEDKSCFADHDLGLPWGGFLRSVFIFILGTYWDSASPPVGDNRT